MNGNHVNVLNFSNPSIRTLHLAWVAFFITFVIWFSHAPLMAFIKQSFGLSSQEVKALLILNVALTIPSRIVVGMLVDKFGPRAIFSILLILSSFSCWGFALATSYEQLALFRFLGGFVGAGFVIGIRLVSEWFPVHQVGIAEGIYAGWGNFGAAVAALTLPALSLAYGGDNGWRYALATTGVCPFCYGIFFYWKVRNMPKGATYFKPRRNGGLEVTSKFDLYFLLAMNVPMYLALAVLSWKLSPAGLGLLSGTMTHMMYVLLALLFVFQSNQIWKVNREYLINGVMEIEKYRFKQVAILNWAYFITFGSELAVVSMLPLFFMDTFSFGAVTAGMLASGFAVTNLIARPSGGWLSDNFGRKKSLSVLIAGLALGYLLLSQIDGNWWISVTVISIMCCSFFVQAGEGAVFAMVPLVKRRMTGQIAGMTGAYGNVGGVTFLTVLSFVDNATFFQVIATSAVLCFIFVQFLDEPDGYMAEVLPDGTVELIEIS